jgi:hypothetical protein
MTTDATEPGDTGAGRVGLPGIIAVTAYLILFAVLLIYALVQFWPQSGQVETLEPITFLGWTLSLPDEIRLFYIVAMAGAVGGLIHGLRSLYWYTGNRMLVWSWLSMYVLLPVVGSALGVVFYLVIRGGFFSTQASVDETSPFGFAALAALVGMFSEQAVLKLKQVAETLLSRPPEGSDSARPETKDANREE